LRRGQNGGQQGERIAQSIKNKFEATRTLGEEKQGNGGASDIRRDIPGVGKLKRKPQPAGNSGTKNKKMRKEEHGTLHQKLKIALG